MKIIVLPEAWASRIAAGEVVERPASVVKELVENALDAGATEIAVWIEGSGISLIRVSDNGEGMMPEDLLLCVERHATSKLKEEGDLFRISTLGFRGEALPSIGSVAKLEIRSRAKQSPVGFGLRVEAGNTEEPAAVGCAAGTTVEVRELFFNTPARRKFLKSPQTELGHISDVINRMALAFPTTHFRLQHGGRILCDYVATDRPEDRLRQVLGDELAAAMVPLHWSPGAASFAGFLSAAPFSLPNTRYLMTYVNSRFVRDRVLTHAILEGYETLLMKGRYPAAVVYLKIPFGEVDVNVHPGKHEVRFRRQAEIHDALAAGVRESLREKAKAPLAPAREAGQNWGSGTQLREAPERYEALFTAGPTGEPNNLTRLAGTRQEPAPDGTGFFSSLEILGQLLGCYLVCGSPNGLALIDQHAAHERVAFERMRRRVVDESVETQHLLLPQTIELPYAESVQFERMLDVLERLGFIVERFGGNTFALKSIPSMLPAGDYRHAVRRMVAEAVDVGRGGALRRDLEERLMTIACHSVIRANRKLEKEEMRALLSALDRAEFATQCPHGRPVLVEFSQAQLERLFKRT